MPSASAGTQEIARKRARIGRPPTEFAGQVEARILDAAARVFLERGFEGASIDLIAETARAGKPTIYARYPDKEALFEAAFVDCFSARNARLATHPPFQGTVEQRLTQIGVALIEETLTDEFLGLCRLAIAEARRRPEFSSGLLKHCRDRGSQAVARLLIEGLEDRAWTDENDPQAAKAGRFFAELVLLPYLLRALALEDSASLHDEIEMHVRERVHFFLAGLRNGGLA